jgi:hypothetical protein
MTRNAGAGCGCAARPGERVRRPVGGTASGSRSAIAAFSAEEQLLDVLAAERARPWWRRLAG